MGKKIIAFGGGRRNSNSEVYLKEALMAAEEMGCEVELIRLNDCDLHPCKSCRIQMCWKNGGDICPLKGDDTWWLVDKFLDSDGFLMAAPVFSLAPASVVSVFRDRVMGSKMDHVGHELFGFEPEFIKGRAKARPGGLISVGGAGTEHWTSLGLPTLFTTTFSAQIEIVDHMNVHGIANPGAATLNEEYLAHARRIGQNVAYSVLHPAEHYSWMGDEKEGVCPGCHLGLLLVKPQGNDVICSVCGRHGKAIIENNQIVRYEFVENDPDDRLTPAGKATHARETMYILEHNFKPYEQEVAKRMEKYTNYKDIITLPPSKTKKKEQTNG